SMTACFGRPELTGQPRLGRAPVAQGRRFGDLEQFGGLADTEPAEETALDESRLPGLEPGEIFERPIQLEEIIGEGGAVGDGIVEGDDGDVATALGRLAPARRF